jgi:D-alanyl-D-alanine carboxypeptidase
MRRAGIVLVIAVAALLSDACRRSSTATPAPAAVVATKAPGSATLDDELAALIAKYHVPGISVVALRGDRIVGGAVAGVRMAGRAERITPADKFHLGSDTKAMTATVAALLVTEGKLAWTTTLPTALGLAASDVHPAWKNVTVQQVLAHRAGLPANPGMLVRMRMSGGKSPLAQQRRELAAAILRDAPEYPPGTKYSYSNVGFILVGAMIEHLDGRAWEDSIHARLFQPLGITTGGFGPPPGSDVFTQPRGHHPNGNPADPHADNPAFYGPAGTVHMSVPDWAKFIALHLRGDPGNTK